MATRNNWTEREMILALDLYFRLPFGRLNRTTKEVKELASLIGRTNNSVALRLVNYAACDPDIVDSGRHGMAGGVGKCMSYWNKFTNDKEQLFLLAEQYKAEYRSTTIEQQVHIDESDLMGKVGKERESIIRQRVNQYAFRDMVLAIYDKKCAITGIDIPDLLVASHIIPWSEDTEQRLNPENGICLSPLYDKAFDRGLIGVRPEDYTIVLSREIKEHHKSEYYREHFGRVENRKITLPIKNKPNPEFLEYHLEKIFSTHN